MSAPNEGRRRSVKRPRCHELEDLTLKHMQSSKIFPFDRMKPKRVLRLRLELAYAEDHANKKISQIERELLGTELRAGHGITGRVLGVDGEWGYGKKDYTVWFWQGKLLYLLAALVSLAIMALGIAKFPELGTLVLGVILLALSIWLLCRDVWKGWIGVSFLQAAVAAAAIAASWRAPLELCAYIWK